MHYMEPVTVPHLAQLCHISPTHLRRMFRAIMDCTPLDYLQLTRMEAACAMLLHTDRSVLEIGAQAGFATGTSFTRQFKKAFGTTPGQWRIKMSKKNGNWVDSAAFLSVSGLISPRALLYTFPQENFSRPAKDLWEVLLLCRRLVLNF